MPNWRVTDHVVDLHVTRAYDMSRRDRRAGPINRLRGSGDIKVTDGMEIDHAPYCGDATAPVPAGERRTAPAFRNVP